MRTRHRSQHPPPPPQSTTQMFMKMTPRLQNPRNENASGLKRPNLMTQMQETETEMPRVTAVTARRTLNAKTNGRNQETKTKVGGNLTSGYRGVSRLLGLFTYLTGTFSGADARKMASEQRRLKRIDDRNADKICFACRGRGHTARDCTNTLAVDSLEGEQTNSAAKSGRDAVGICYRYVSSLVFAFTSGSDPAIRQVAAPGDITSLDAKKLSTHLIPCRLPRVLSVRGRDIWHLNVRRTKRRVSTRTAGAANSARKQLISRRTVRYGSRVGTSFMLLRRS